MHDDPFVYYRVSDVFAIKKLGVSLFLLLGLGFASLLAPVGDIFIFGHLVLSATSHDYLYFATTRGFFGRFIFWNKTSWRFHFKPKQIYQNYFSKLRYMSS